MDTQHQDANIASFPASRYFQVHFEHLETQLAQLLSRIEQLQDQVAEIEQQLPSSPRPGKRQHGLLVSCPVWEKRDSLLEAVKPPGNSA